MKATLEYQLPEDQAEFDIALRGSDWHYLVWKIDQNARAQLKHGEPTQEQAEAYQHLRDMIREAMDERGLKFD